MKTLYRYKYKIFLILFIICLISSVILSLEKLQQYCPTGKGCETVQNSQYAFTLGIRNSNYGIVIFSILSSITISQILKPTKLKKKIILLSIILGSLVSLYLLYLQFYILKAYCAYCFAVDFSLLLSLLISILTWKK